MSDLPCRPLGTAGPPVSVVGVGTWAMGGPWRMGWGRQDDRESERTLRAAVDAGVTWVDTAPVYGDGHAEELVGRCLQGRDDVLLLTKCGLAADGVDLTPAAVRRSCEQSLRRLRRERIDVLQLHWPDPGVEIEQTWQALVQLRDAGLVRWLGLSNHPLPLVERAHALASVDVIQLRLHLLDQRSLVDLVPWARSNGAAVLAYSALASGLLALPLDLRTLPSGDWRRTDERFRFEAAAAPAVLAAMADLGVPPATAALAWALGQEGVTGVIGGVRDRSELPDLLGAAAQTLTPSQRAVLDRAAAPTALADRAGLR